MNRKKNHDSHHPDAPPATPEPPATADAPDAAPPAAPAAPPAAPTPAEIELAALREKHLRLLADFDNFRKRQAREREDYLRRATEGLMLELLPVLDHLELALASAPNKQDPVVKGVQLVNEQFLAALARYDLKPFSSAGAPFDPARHESVSEMPSPSVPAHHVLQQLRGGYLLGGRLLRAAQVVISSGPAPTAAAPEPVCDGAAPTQAKMEA